MSWAFQSWDTSPCIKALKISVHRVSCFIHSFLPQFAFPIIYSMTQFPQTSAVFSVSLSWSIMSIHEVVLLELSNFPYVCSAIVFLLYPTDIRSCAFLHYPFKNAFWTTEEDQHFSLLIFIRIVSQHLFSWNLPLESLCPE